MPLLPDIKLGALDGQDSSAQIESIVKQLNEWGRLISNDDRTKIVKDDSGTQRFLQGYQRGGFSNGDVGVKVSQIDTDVLDAEDDDLIFSTDFNLFKIVTKLTTSFSFTTSAGSNSTLLTINHNLGYKPIILPTATDVVLGAYITTSRDVTLPYILLSTGASSLVVSAGILLRSITATSVVFEVIIYTGAGEACSGTINAYVLRETVN